MITPRTKEMLAVYLYDHQNHTVPEIIDLLSQHFRIYHRMTPFDPPQPGQVYEGGYAHGKKRQHRIEQVDGKNILYQVLTDGVATYAPRWCNWETFKRNHHPRGRRPDLEG